jgi:hypothetical protein
MKLRPVHLTILAVALALTGGTTVALANGQPSRPTGTTATPTGPAPASSSTPAAPAITASASASASAANPVPLAAMLTAADVGAGFRTSDDGQGDDHGSLDMELFRCGNPPSDQGTGASLGSRRRLISTGDDAYLIQQTRLTRPGTAAQRMENLRAAFSGPCAAVPANPNAFDRSRFTILESDDSSLLMRQDRTYPEGTRTDYRIVIRRGDAYTEIRTWLPGLTENQARALARKAASRLCEASTTC